MIDIGAMLAGTSIVLAQAPFRAQVEWARIQDKPTTIRIRRGTTVLADQVVRLEMGITMTPSEGASGISTMGEGILFGIQDHPTLPDTDIDEWDTFVLGEKEYTITHVNRHLHGQIQAEFGATG